MINFGLTDSVRMSSFLHDAFVWILNDFLLLARKDT